MSDRRCLVEVVSTAKGNEDQSVEVYRDNDTKTYRVFTYKGRKEVPVLGRIGHTLDDCLCADISFDDLVTLSAALQAAVRDHTEWCDYSDDEDE